MTTTTTPTLTTPDPLLVTAVRTLAGRCDGAETQDGVGYNGTDTVFGRSLATVAPDAWSPGVQRRAWEMLRKYRGQLASVGIDYDAITEPAATDGGKAEIRVVDVDNGVVFVRLPYGDPAEPKYPLGASWNRPLKRWEVSPAKWAVVLEWADKWGIPVSENAREAVANPAAVEIPPAGSVDVVGGLLAVSFPYNPVLVDAVRSVPGRAWNADSKTWTAPLTSVRAVRALAAEHNLALSPNVDLLPDVEAPIGPSVDVAGGRFVIRFDYDRDLIARVRDVPSARWNGPLRGWVCDLEAAVEVVHFVVATEATVGDGAADVLSGTREALERIRESAATDADVQIPNLGGDLLPFQRAGVAYALRAMGFAPGATGVWARPSELRA